MQRIEDAPEYLCRCFEGEAFSGGVVVVSDIGVEFFIGAGREVCFSGQCAAQTTDGVFDSALLPGGMGITEEGLHADGIGEAPVFGKLGAVVESAGLAQGRWQGGELPEQAPDHRSCGFVRLSGDEQKAGPKLERAATSGGRSAMLRRSLKKRIGLPPPRRSRPRRLLARGSRRCQIVLLRRAMIDVTVD